MPADKLVGRSGEFILELKTYPYKAATRKVDFGPNHKGWLYSIARFEDEKLENQVRNFVLRHMSGQKSRGY
jgi:hypothetical protein